MKNYNHNKDRDLGARKIADKIRAEMKVRNLNQRGLADLSGISQGIISSILGGKSTHIEWYTLFKIAQALSISIDSLITGSQVEIINNLEIREIIKAMPPEAKLFFRSTDRIPPENVKLILDMIKLIVKEIDAPAKNRKK